MHLGLLCISVCLLTVSQQINPYHVLGLPPSSSEKAVTREFKRLKKKHKKNEYLQQAIKEAHDQIMTEKSLYQTSRGRISEWEIQKSQTIQSNKLIARSVVFVFGIALKLLPFLLCFLVIKGHKKDQGAEESWFSRELTQALRKYQRGREKLKKAFQTQ